MFFVLLASPLVHDRKRNYYVDSKCRVTVRCASSLREINMYTSPLLARMLVATQYVSVTVSQQISQAALFLFEILYTQRHRRQLSVDLSVQSARIDHVSTTKASPEDTHPGLP